jgi:hypothetical protein
MKLLPAFFIFLIVVLLNHFSQAQEVFVPASRSQSLATITACLNDSWSAFGNQAGLAKINHPTISGTFQNRYLIKELSTNAGVFILPVQTSILAVSVYQFGRINFRHEKYGLSYARAISPHLLFGMQFNYYRFFLAEENQYLRSYGLELGFQYQVKPTILLGIHALNPYKTSIKTYSGKYDYPSNVNLGAAIEISKSFDLFAEIEKYFSYPLGVKTGIEYNILNRLYLRTGIFGRQNQLSAGMGFVVKKLKIDLAVAYNQHLGNSPSASFQYQF